jgi:hypothetical protein
MIAFGGRNGNRPNASSDGRRMAGVTDERDGDDNQMDSHSRLKTSRHASYRDHVAHSHQLVSTRGISTLDEDV